MKIKTSNYIHICIHISIYTGVYIDEFIAYNGGKQLKTLIYYLHFISIHSDKSGHPHFFVVPRVEYGVSFLHSSLVNPHVCQLTKFTSLEQLHFQTYIILITLIISVLSVVNNPRIYYNFFIRMM